MTTQKNIEIISNNLTGKKRKREDIEEATNYEADLVDPSPWPSPADFEAFPSCSNASLLEDTVAFVAPVIEGNMEGVGSSVAAAAYIITNIKSIIPKEEIDPVAGITGILRRAILRDPIETESVVSGVSSNFGAVASQFSDVSSVKACGSISAPQAEIDALVDSFSFILPSLG